MIAIAVATAVLAAAAILPLGAPAHAVALRTALPALDSVLTLAMAAAALAAAVAPLVVAAPRIRSTTRAARARGARLLTTDLAALALGGGLGALAHATIEPLTREMSLSTIGAGLGLLATSVATGSIGIAPAPTRRTASPVIAALIALALALGALPGGSPMAFAIAALAWSGLPEPDAVELAALAAVPLHATVAVRALLSDDLAWVVEAPGSAALAGAVGVVAACLALAALRAWSRTRTVAGAALWTGTLGLALLGHAYVAAP